MNAYLSAAREMVMDGSRISGTVLSERLEFTLSAAVARYMHEPLRYDMIVTRVVRAIEERVRPDEARLIGDDCLITCGLFPERIRRMGGSLTFYSDMGRTAYDYAGMIEEAFGFSHMLTVLIAGAPRPGDSVGLLIDRARAGDKGAQQSLGNVIAFRKK